MKSFLNKKLSAKTIKSTISLYMVRTSVFFENQIYIRCLDVIDHLKRIDVLLSICKKNLLLNWRCPQGLRFLLPIFNRAVAGYAVLRDFLDPKLISFAGVINNQINKIKYWIINPEQVRANGGVAIFSYESTDSRKIFSFVALAHVLIFLLLYSLSTFQSKKSPDIMIELGGSPQASSGIPQSASDPVNPNPIKDAPKGPPNPEIVKAQELKRLEKQKEIELERDRRKEVELDKKRQREREREIEIERRKELERDRQRIKDSEQEKKREQDRLKEQERQQKLQEKQKEKQKEKLVEPKKLDKDGTLPPPPPPVPPAPSPNTPPTAPPTAPPSPPVQSAPSPSQSPSGASSSSSGSGQSVSASVSNLPAAAPTLDADAKASYLDNPKPAYPFLAFKMKIEGKVILFVEVSETGTVNKVQVAETSRNESLDRSAVEAVKNWKFTPARKNGVMVAQVVRVPITFSLKNR